ncbi:MAG: LysR family transcriptional regulator [Mangrovicoccus sp.]|nr:LysR family transcriptional regulator [Mangrovicoccus sp.]
MDLNALREFTAVISEGSFAAAARRLNTPKSTVSKRIQDLEAALGTKLIERTTRRLRLTPEGAVVLGRAERILADAEEITEALSKDHSAVRGHLRLATPTLFGQTMLAPVAAQCRALYPELTLECVLQDSLPDLMEEGYDAAIRIGTGHDETLTALPLGNIRRCLVAAPGRLPATLESPEDLTDAPTLAQGHGLIQTWQLSGPEGTKSVRIAATLTMSSPAALRMAALAGAGVALLPIYAVAADLAKGDLVDVLPGWSGLPRPVALVYPGAQALTHRLRAFSDLMAAHAKKQLDAATTEPW